MRVGTIVRVELHGRRVGGWVVALDEAAPDRALKPIAKVTGDGPAPELVDLAQLGGVALGRPTGGVPPHRVAAPGRAERPGLGGAVSACRSAARAGARDPHAPRRRPAPARRSRPRRAGDALVLAPTHAMAASLATRLRAEGMSTALLPDDWARAAAGASRRHRHAGRGVGAAAAARMPCSCWTSTTRPTRRSARPTWHARDVAIERARRARCGVHARVPCPSLEALAAGELDDAAARRRAGGMAGRGGGRPATRAARPRPVLGAPGRGRRARRSGWCASSTARAAPASWRARRVVSWPAARSAGPPCSSTTRACGAGGAAPRGRRSAPTCGSTRLKTLRMGVTRAAEELEALVRRPVAEVTADGTSKQRAPILVGTEAVLHRVRERRRGRVPRPRPGAAGAAVPGGRAGDGAAGRAPPGWSAGGRRGGRRTAGGCCCRRGCPTTRSSSAAVHADPDAVDARRSGARRAELRFPPVTAMAVVSGEAAGGLRRRAARRSGGGAAPGSRSWARPTGAGSCGRPTTSGCATRSRRRPRPPGRLRVNVDPSR